MGKTGKVLVLTIQLFCWSVGIATADKSSVTIDVPQSIQKGAELTIRVTGTHSGNSALHYTNGFTVKVTVKEQRGTHEDRRSLDHSALRDAEHDSYSVSDEHRTSLDQSALRRS